MQDADAAAAAAAVVRLLLAHYSMDQLLAAVSLSYVSNFAAGGAVRFPLSLCLTPPFPSVPGPPRSNK